MSDHLDKVLREVNRDLDAAVRKLDNRFYNDPVPEGDLDDQLSKVYQAIFAAGDAVNAARHINKRGIK